MAFGCTRRNSNTINKYSDALGKKFGLMNGGYPDAGRVHSDSSRFIRMLKEAIRMLDTEGIRMR